MQITSYQIKISGSGEIKEPIAFPSQKTITITAETVKEEILNNQDGTFTKRYVLKIDPAQEIEIE